MTPLLTALQSAEQGSLCRLELAEQLADALGLGKRNKKARWLCYEALRGSIDAALALVERVLPGWWPSVAQVGPGKWSADIYDPSDTRSLSPTHAPIPPQALVIALVKAKEAQNGTV
jgi:hypothetical protein